MRRRSRRPSPSSRSRTAAAARQGGDEVTVDVDEPTESATSPAPTSESPTEPTSTPPTSEPPATGAPEVVETIATGLVAPWGLAFLPDGDAVVTERDTAKVLLDRRRRPARGHRDRHRSARRPRRARAACSAWPSRRRSTATGTLYFYVSTRPGQPDRHRRRYDKGGLGRTNPILTGIPLGGIHDGGRIAFGPDGFLYASTGETGDPALAQDRDSLGGKILRITPEGQAGAAATRSPTRSTRSATATCRAWP